MWLHAHVLSNLRSTGYKVKNIMKSKAALQAIPSALAALGINTIPAGIVLVGGESAETAMVLYFLENILLILFTAARVRILAPAHDEAYNSAAPPDYTRIEVNGRVVSQRRTPRNRGMLLKGYLTFSLSFSLGAGVFLSLFLFMILGANVSSTAIISGIAGIAAFQLFHFITDLFLLGRLSPRRAERLLEHSMGRVALLYLAVGVGAFLTLIVERWFVLPFAILKTVVDLTAPIQTFRERDQKPKWGETV